MLKDLIKKSANEILDEKRQKKGADKANFQYKNELEILVQKNGKTIEHYTNKGEV